MNIPDVWKPFNGSVSFVLLRHQTRWGLKCSTLAMGSSTLMVSTKRSGCVAINAKRLSICAVLLKRKKKISNSHSCAGSMSVGSRRNVKRVIKWVIFSFLVARQKTTQKKVCRGKDGRIIAPRKKASAGYKVKEQQWSASELDRAFDLWEANKTKPKISRCPSLPYPRKSTSPTLQSVSDFQAEEEVGKGEKLQGEREHLEFSTKVRKRVTFPNFNRLQVGNC